MIKTRQGETEIRGDLGEIRADLIVVVKSIKTALMESGISEEDADASIKDDVELGLMSEEEALKKLDEEDKEFEKKLKKKKKEMALKLIEKLFGDEEEETNE